MRLLDLLKGSRKGVSVYLGTAYIHVHVHRQFKNIFYAHLLSLCKQTVCNSKCDGLLCPQGEVVQYERVGEIYPTLAALLRAKSKHFTENIGKQVHVHVHGIARSINVHFLCI